MENKNLLGKDSTEMVMPEPVKPEVKADKKAEKKTAKVFMSLPSGLQLVKDEPVMVPKEDMDYLKKAFGEGLVHILE